MLRKWKRLKVAEINMYALPDLHRRVLFWLAVFFTSGPLAAITMTYTDNAGTGGTTRVATGTVTFIPTGNPNELRAVYRHYNNPVFSFGFTYRTKRNGIWQAGANLTGTYNTNVFVATFPMPGDGIEMTRPATAAKPWVETKFEELYAPPGSEKRTLTFTTTNATADDQPIGIYGGGYVFGLQMIAPGGTYNQSITIESGDTNTYTAGYFDFDRAAADDVTGAGTGYLFFHDGDGDGTFTGPLDGVNVPSQYFTPRGSPQTYGASEKRPVIAG
jgi:hypothetical protein